VSDGYLSGTIFNDSGEICYRLGKTLFLNHFYGTLKPAKPDFDSEARLDKRQ